MTAEVLVSFQIKDNYTERMKEVVKERGHPALISLCARACEELSLFPVMDLLCILICLTSLEALKYN